MNPPERLDPKRIREELHATTKAIYGVQSSELVDALIDILCVHINRAIIQSEDYTWRP